MNLLERRLLNDYQRDVPLVARPFAALADALGTDERWVIDTLTQGVAAGRVSRVGAVFRPGAFGASTLAALSVPPARLDDVAAAISARPEVNHNYEREHAFNLWFVATAEDEIRLQRALLAIEATVRLPLIVLPLIADYYIDLGFDLDGGPKSMRSREAARVAPMRLQLDPGDRALVARLQDGLPLVPRPFAALADAAGWSSPAAESQAIARIAEWIEQGAIKRFGVVVRHRAFGYAANAMCVWDVPAPEADRLGRRLAAEADVTLCYRRARAGPAWPYNFFCMLHGCNRVAVEVRYMVLSARHGLARYPHAVLFSRRAFKQRGARYVESVEAARG